MQKIIIVLVYCTQDKNLKDTFISKYKICNLPLLQLLNLVILGNFCVRRLIFLSKSFDLQVLIWVFQSLLKTL